MKVENDLMFHNLNLTGAEIPEMICLPPDENNPSVHADVKTLIAWVLSGYLKLYSGNRGTGVPSAKTVKSVMQGIDPNNLGECTIGSWKENLTLCDFNSRTYGIVARYIKGEMTETEMDMALSVRYTTDFLNTYQVLNSGDTRHQLKEKIQCPDLVFGKHLAAIREIVGDDCMEKLGNNKWSVISVFLYNLAGKQTSWKWSRTYQMRNKIAGLVNKCKSISISKADIKKLAKAIQFWHAMMMEFKASSTVKGTTVASSAGFFGYVICSELDANPERKFSRNQKNNAKKIVKNILFIDKAAPSLCRDDKQDVIDLTATLDKLLKRKVSSKEEVEELELVEV